MDDNPAAEYLDLDAIVAEEIVALHTMELPPVPNFVLSRGRSLEAAVPPDAVRLGFPWGLVEQMSRSAQQSLARLVPGTRHEIANDSGHVIQLDRPALVIDAIRQVVGAVRNPSTWPKNPRVP
jgi:pimeloyl-ACP methyl ester carboxylesterase